MVAGTNTNTNTNVYSSAYFPVVYRALQSRLLEQLVELPEALPVADHSAAGGSFPGLQWLDYDHVYAQRGA